MHLQPVLLFFSSSGHSAIGKTDQAFHLHCSTSPISSAVLLVVLRYSCHLCSSTLGKVLGVGAARKFMKIGLKLKFLKVIVAAPSTSPATPLKTLESQRRNTVPEPRSLANDQQKYVVGILRAWAWGKAGACCQEC